MTAITSSLPLPIQKAIAGLPDLLASLLRARPGSVRAMRPERKQAIIQLLTAALQACSLQHSGALCVVDGHFIRPKTLQELANCAGLSRNRAKRALADAYALGLMNGEQKKRKAGPGILEVSVGLRCFTELFWKKLGLWKLYQKSMKWAKDNGKKRKFILPFKQVAWRKVRSAGQSAGRAVKDALAGLKKLARPQCKLPIVKSDPLQKQAPVSENPVASSGTSSVQLRLAWIKDHLGGGEFLDFASWLKMRKKE